MSRLDELAPPTGRSEHRIAQIAPSGCSRIAYLVEPLDHKRGRVLAGQSSELVGSIIDIDPSLYEVEQVELRGPEGNKTVMLSRTGPAEAATPQRVLVIDDEPDVRRYYDDLFGQIGCEVTLAATAHEGLDRFGFVDPNLVLVDVRLPDMNGYEVCRALRERDTGHVHLVLMSADPAMVEQHRASGAGADLALVGPLGLSQMRSVVDALPRHQIPRRTQPVEMPAPTGLRLEFFSTPTIASESRSCALPAGIATDVMATLAIHHPSPLSISDLASTAWGERIARSGTVHTAISRLRSTLERAGIGNPIRTVGDRYQLDVDLDSIDTRRFEQRCRDLDPGLPPHQFVEIADDILSVDTSLSYGSSQLPIVEAARVRIQEARAVLEERMATRAIVAGDPARAVDIARDLTQRELWRETGWTILACALYRAGRQRDALEAMRLCERTLIETAGVDPCQRVRHVEQLILEQHPDLDDPKYLLRLSS